MILDAATSSHLHLIYRLGFWFYLLGSLILIENYYFTLEKENLWQPKFSGLRTFSFRKGQKNPRLTLCHIFLLSLQATNYPNKFLSGCTSALSQEAPLNTDTSLLHERALHHSNQLFTSTVSHYPGVNGKKGIFRASRRAADGAEQRQLPPGPQHQTGSARPLVPSLTAMTGRIENCSL